MDAEKARKMFDRLYMDGYSFQEIREFRQCKELRDDIAMRATEEDVRMFQDSTGRISYAKAKYAYADQMLKARVSD